MREHVDTVTNPQVAIPIVASSSFMTMFMDNLPVMMSIGSFIYLVLLIIHKSWSMYRDWKGRNNEQSQE